MRPREGAHILAKGSAQSRSGSSGRRPAPFSDWLAHTDTALFAVDRPWSRSGRGPLRLWNAGKCVSAAAGAFYSVFQILGSGGREGCLGQGLPGVAKGFWTSSDVDSLFLNLPGVFGGKSFREKEGSRPLCQWVKWLDTRVAWVGTGTQFREGVNKLVPRGLF